MEEHCGAAQRHNESKQLELMGYSSVRAAVVFRDRSKASSLLLLPVQHKPAQAMIYGLSVPWSVLLRPSEAKPHMSCQIPWKPNTINRGL
ncbi:hypothetical protein JOQ06_011959 [Pogonophryne albipinna]|uniref:Uncharacterized protein n=1 Tax=Pogonophryne albipinna TaxID=1090488 RepID=A0AAD6BCE3_9TELE|nr:hypothetical protein JOQ06_011959 [Pogonophryne albipinna]